MVMPSIESWAEAFQFSSELDTLEAAYQAQHRQKIEQQVKQPALQPNRFPASSQREADTPFVEEISEKIANKLGDYLGNAEILSQYLNTETLERDNAIMARQIEELYARLRQKDESLQAMQRQLNAFRRIAGPLYFKGRA